MARYATSRTLTVLQRWEQIMEFTHCRTRVAAGSSRAGAVAKVLPWPRFGQFVLLLASMVVSELVKAIAQIAYFRTA